MDIASRLITLPHGITLSCRCSGADDARQTALLLHGFPEGAFVWEPLMRALGPAVRCIAPNLRGYERSSAPTDVQAYRARHLVADIEALVQAAGAPVDVLVAHDWGGGVAWNLAAARPELLRQLVIVNSPHPGALLRELRDCPAQQAASAYMNDFCHPDAVARLARDDHAVLWHTLERVGPAAWLTDAMRQRYRDVWSHGLAGALNYYRASPLRPAAPGDDRLRRLALPSTVVDVRVTTTVVWGLADDALLPGLLDGLDHWVTPLRIVRVPGASHWIVHERPDVLLQAVQGALRADR